MAGKAQTGRAERSGKVQQLRAAVPAPGWSAHRAGAADKVYRLWRAEHPEFEQIVFHGLRHSSATYQLLQSDGDFKSVQGNTGHATASVLMDTYAHTQDKPRLELTEKIEANFYSQDLTSAASQPRQNEKPAATKISGREILEAIRLMDADERRELTRALFA